MSSAVLLTPLRYLKLEDERGIRLLFRDLIVTGLLAAALALPFILVSTSNYFHKDGFIDKIGTFSSVLTGFYVAGLLAVATFSAAISDMDGKIEVGAIALVPSTPDEDRRTLSRREYVCYIFGYLAFCSLAFTVTSILTVAVSSGIPTLHDIHIATSGYTVTIKPDAPRILGILVFSIFLSHLVVVTCHGLYYLTDRLYAKKAETLDERPDFNHD